MNPAQHLADLMNVGGGADATARGSARQDADGAPAPPEEQHLEKVVQAVYALLGAEAPRRFGRRLAEQAHLIEDADDLQQLAVLAFVAAYSKGSIRTDEKAGAHTAASVSAYLWGACNRIFVEMLRRSRYSSELQDELVGSPAPVSNSELFGELVESHVEDSETRLWEVLEAVVPMCKPEDIVMTYLHGCGFSVAEIRRMMKVSVNTPANALKRVGGKVRAVIGLDGSGGGPTLIGASADQRPEGAATVRDEQQ